MLTFWMPDFQGIREGLSLPVEILNMNDDQAKKPIAAGESSFNLINVDKVFDSMNLQPESVFLDLACGSGLYSVEAAKRKGGKGVVYGVDLWGDGIRLLEERIKEEGIINVTPIQSDASSIPLEDNSIDTCLMATVLHDFVEDSTADAVLDEVARLLKPGGTLVIIEFKKIEGPPGPPIHIRMTPEEVRARLQPTGLVPRSEEVLDVGPYNYLMRFSARN